MKPFGALLALISAVSLGAAGQQPQEPVNPHAPAAPTEITPAQYRVYRPDGHAASLDDVIAAMDDADAVFVGEEHDDPGAHLLEAEIVKRMFSHFTAPGASHKRSVVLSLEMFERDVQSVVDEYLGGMITEKHFLSSSRPWAKYATDYRAMVEFAREHKLPVIAANAPGRYANRAARLGRGSLDELSADAKRWLPPLPYGAPAPEYEAKFNALMGGADPASPHAPQHLIDAQVLWDSGMAYSIAEALMARPDGIVVNVNGGFHSEEHLGILTQLSRYRPGTRMLTVQVYSGRGFPNFDISKLGKLGDFVILTDPALKGTP